MIIFFKHKLEST